MGYGPEMLLEQVRVAIEYSVGLRILRRARIKD